ncbi:OmpH family outer membrane protein [Thalassospira mesophila]|uniref:Membrane protein n=1 Tax=Thalassospira mesophila TaxID=1293891 RepID=A0A1Y2KYZ6_9PROT|nr:OmpH family outer membrane protein [Thalassospira mesophila]OSQ37939.1 membrane protein [Thalassospira mesophila]
MYMMKTAQRFFLIVLMVTGLGLHTQARAAEAKQETTAIVMIVDFEGIMREASAMQDMRKQVEKRRNSYQTEIEKRQQALRDEDQKLAQQRTLLSADVLQQKRAEFQKKVAEFQKFAQGRNKVLDEAVNEGRIKFQKKLIEIIADVAEERKATLVLHKSQVILHANAMDATKEIFEKVNAAIPSLTVEFKEGS